MAVAFFATYLSTPSGKPMGKVASNWLVAPYRVNSLHISAFYNHTKRAQEYLAAGVPFIKGAFGSPLTVALQRKTMKCVEVFLNYLINLAKEKDDWSGLPLPALGRIS